MFETIKIKNGKTIYIDPVNVVFVEIGEDYAWVVVAHVEEKLRIPRHDGEELVMLKNQMVM